MGREIALLIPISAVIGGIVMIIMIRRYEYLEKEKMIEKGMDPGSLKRISGKSGWGAVRFAFTAMGVGLGIFLGSLLDNMGIDDDTAYPAMILVMGGLGLLLGTHYAKKREAEEDKLN